jgi:hypothetical protein
MYDLARAFTPGARRFSAGSTWRPLKRPRKSSIRTPLAKAGELGEVDTDSDGVMRLERSAVLARYEEMKRRQQTGLQKKVDGSEQPGIFALE